MRRTLLMAALILLFCGSALSQMPGFPGAGGPNATFSNVTTGGAPVPVSPTSAESLGLSIPEDTASSSMTPPAQERTQTIIGASQDQAYAYAPEGATYSGTEGLAGATGETTGTATDRAIYNRMVVPTTGYAPNRLYITYAPRTVASCNLYANLPLWMQTSGMGSIWFYELYPRGTLDTQYAGFVNYPGWYKRWFFADIPGWHILQYYCGGWSNYAYIYVYGQGGYWVNPYPQYDDNPYPYPYWDSSITYTYPPTGHTYYSYQSTTTYGQ